MSRLRPLLDWARRHRTWAAAIVALLVTLRAYRWLLPAFYEGFFHDPIGTLTWVGGHWLGILAVTGAVFAGSFVIARLGIDAVARKWLAKLDAGEPDPNWVGPGFNPRPGEQVHIPPRMG